MLDLELLLLHVLHVFVEEVEYFLEQLLLDDIHPFPEVELVMFELVILKLEEGEGTLEVKIKEAESFGVCREEAEDIGQPREDHRAG